MKKISMILAALGLMSFVAPAFADDKAESSTKTEVTADGAKKTKKSKSKVKNADGTTTTTTTESEKKTETK